MKFYQASGANLIILRWTLREDKGAGVNAIKTDLFCISYCSSISLTAFT